MKNILGMLQEQDVLIESAVIPLPHKIRALSRAIASDLVRYLLTDEVGLGRIIMALRRVAKPSSKSVSRRYAVTT